MDAGEALLVLMLITGGAGILIMLTPQRHATVIRMIALVAGLAVLADSTYIFALYDYKEGGLQFDLQYPWIENVGFLKENGISLHLAVDGLASALVLLNGLVTFAAVLVSWKIGYRNKDFFVLFMVLTTGVFGVYTSQDLFFWFFFYELAVLPMYLLIVVWGSTNKEYGAMKLTMMLVGGSVLVWVGIFAVFTEAGAGTFDLPVLREIEFSTGFATTFFPFFMIGCGVLAGLWPLHTWSPDGHVAAPTAVSMLHAGVLMKLGAFGIVRLGIELLPEGTDFWMPVLLVLGAIAAVYGAFSAIHQTDLKFVVGYSSVSHMGFVLMGLGTMNTIGVSGAGLQMFSHGVMTALFFAMVGAIYDQAHTRDITAFGGIIRKMPLFVIFFGIAGLTSLGLPGLSGFVAEFHIFVGTVDAFPLFAALGVLSAALTAVYILRLLGRAALGPLNMRWNDLTDLSRWEMLAGVTLIVPIVAMGVWPDPFVDRIASTVVDLPGVEAVAGSLAKLPVIRG
ncbi:MAG: NADH-quinone oxidoreductase subunit M [Dehalococcoidia bacterium]